MSVTRYYLPSSSSPDTGRPAPVTIAPDPFWSEGNEALALKTAAQTSPSGTALSEKTVALGGGPTLLYQMVTDSIPEARVIEGSLAFALAARIWGGGEAANLIVRVKVVSSDGQTIRGPLLSSYVTSPQLPFSTNRSSRTATGLALTPVNALAGDRLVFEVASAFATIEPTGYNAYLLVGDPTAGSDMATDNNVSQPSGRSWFELNLTDPPPPPPPVVTKRLVWSAPESRIFEAGLDRGVLYLNDGRVVPWNGLISVDESGGEGSSTYYIDGRPFLHLPKPKEFQATLKAFTYPDEFSSVMGLTEAADGMYLDSQMGDSFGLSYRTLVGSMVSGEAEGYKIHIIYNATIVPSAVSYSSLSETVNPVEFSWDIQAIPSPVVGYRPTAHVVIDTRHMDATRIAEIEDLLYGSSSVQASLPSAQAVFDILSFGDAIVITDNADGTWTAEGSYHNIYMIGDGIFQIDNVNAVDNGDGTFHISTTNA